MAAGLPTFVGLAVVSLPASASPVPPHSSLSRVASFPSGTRTAIVLEGGQVCTVDPGHGVLLVSPPGPRGQPGQGGCKVGLIK